MGIYEQLAIPPSSHHLELLNFFHIVSLLVFIPFIGMVFGASLFSYVFTLIGRRKRDNKYIRFSKDLLDKLTISRSVGLGVGILPAFSVTFVYAQLLYGADVITTGVLFFACILYSLGFAMLYRFKTTFQVETIILSMKDYMSNKGTDSENLPEDVKKYEDKLDESNSKSGRWGFVLMFFATFLFIGATTLAANPQDWPHVGNIFAFFINGEILINFLYFLALSMTITGISILFFFFIWQGGLKNMTEDYKKFVQQFGVTLAFLSVMVLLVLMFVKLIYLPQNALSFQVFFYSGLSLLFLVIVGNLLFAIIRNAEIKYVSAAFILMFLVITFSIINDELVLANAIKEHVVEITAKADEEDQKKLAAVVTTSDVNAEEIYNTKCIACHKFDQKLVGPPYNETVPKYNGNVQKLADFIYSPTKVDAGYPPMPNQGLTKKEATAMAQYLIQQLEAGK